MSKSLPVRKRGEAASPHLNLTRGQIPLIRRQRLSPYNTEALKHPEGTIFRRFRWPMPGDHRPEIKNSLLQLVDSYHLKLACFPRAYPKTSGTRLRTASQPLGKGKQGLPVTGALAMFSCCNTRQAILSFLKFPSISFPAERTASEY